jgi:NAD(P)-dependent dehydrogenase (short-subunit alcohol dehydrogenase family)
MTITNNNKLRRKALESIYCAKSGHPGGVLSSIDIIEFLFNSEMKYSVKNFKKIDRDRFILSKGHSAPALYAVSKAGLISLGQVIARFGSNFNIRCNTIAAGIIASDMGNQGLKSSVVAKAAENIILKRFGSFEDVAKAAIFLASNESSYITAQTINVNGGLYF